MFWILFLFIGSTVATNSRDSLQTSQLDITQIMRSSTSHPPPPLAYAPWTHPTPPINGPIKTVQTEPPNFANAMPAIAPPNFASPTPAIAPPNFASPTPAIAPPTGNSLEKFSTKLFQVIAPNHIHTNVIYSPISVQALLTFIYATAAGETANQLQAALEVPVNKTEAALLFQYLLKSPHLGRAQLIMANKVYHTPRLEVSDSMKNYAWKYFESELEATDFTMPNRAAQQINDWVAQKTQNHIRNLVSPSSLNARTPMMLVNAIYFKAKWAREFSTIDTQRHDFHVSTQRSVPVDMMYTEDTFRYGIFDNLQASVLELPYLDSDLSMLIILPNAVDGLLNLERRLNGIDLSDLAASLSSHTVTVRIPKFRIEFETDMLEPLRMLGITQLFSDQAQLNMFSQNNQVGVGQVQHKAYIDVNEAGSEAAAASFAKFIPLSLPPLPIYFTANHPFMFAIRNGQSIHFVGHVATF